jgi:glycosyl transferase family 25
MKVYVINLDRDEGRLAHMQRELAGVAFTRAPAVDGTKIPETRKGLTRFELACLASHRDVWRRLLDSADAAACVLEDDIHLEPGFAALVNDAAWVPPDAHSVKIDTYLQRVRLGERRPVPGGRAVAPLFTRHESSAAYVITRAGAERYLALTDPPTLPADYALFPKQARRLGLSIYQLVPAVAIQDHLIAAASGGGAIESAMHRSAEPRRSLAARLRREAARLAEQAVDTQDALYARAVLKAETTTVPVG